MNHGALRRLWPRPGRAIPAVASTTARCLSSSASWSKKYFNPHQAMYAVRKQQQKHGGGDSQSRSYEVEGQGNLNLGLAAWARKNGIDLEFDKKMKASKSKVASREMGVYLHYSVSRHPSEYHMKDLVLTTPLTVKYMAEYEHRTKNPLWIVLNASFNHPNVVRTTSMKKARRALLAALKRNHYLPNGKAFSDDLVRGTELYGTLKIFVNEPLKTVNTPLAKLATHFNDLLNKDVMAAMRRPVTKMLRPDRQSPVSKPRAALRQTAA